MAFGRWSISLFLVGLCRAQKAIVGSFGTYPGYTGSLSSVSGVMSVDTWSSGVQTLSWSLSNVDSRCAEACPATNCCGVHIHVGKTCSVAADIGGHYYDSTTYTTDPWLTVMYNATDSPSNTLSLPVTTGLTASDILGRAMVIHDFEGGRIACGIIKEATVSSFSAYPGYTGNLMSVGSALIDSGFGKQTLSWIFQSGLDTRCSEACMAPNCCGVHIHVGFDCTDASTIGGHWWNSDALEADPWQTIMYNTTGGMPSVASSIEVDTQLSTVQINKRALVIHDFTGARIACGNIMMPVSEAIVSSFSLYPGSSSSLTVEGVMSVISSEDASGTQTLSWSLTGLDPACANDISLTELTLGSYRYFRAHDGFVALNLTKGITETLQKTVHNRTVPRLSRYRDAEVVNNREPFSSEIEPTVPPGFMENYRIAPVFLEWAPCTTRYRISAGCLNQNQVVGWAVATSRSLCTNLRMVSCREQDPLLDPLYHCTDAPVRGQVFKGSIQGLCGRTVPPPTSEVIDELSALLLLDGWPENRLPNVTHGWYDVWPEECINNTEKCESQWNSIEMLGLICVGLTILLALLPWILDCRTDAKIRTAMAFQEEIKTRSKKGATIMF